MMTPVVSTQWLQQTLDDPDLVILDGTWHLPNEDRDAFGEYREAKIKGAQFFDIDAISDTSCDLPHMIPTGKQFGRQVGELGVSNDSKIVVYDSYGLFSAARVWWLFRHFGHKNVAVLEGGLAKWIADGNTVTSATTPANPQSFEAYPSSNMVRDAKQVLDISNHGSAQIIDARAPARFAGSAPEPRAGLRSGSIPNSINVFFKEVQNQDGTLKSKSELETLFANLGVDVKRPIVASCGSGVTAAVLVLALETLGHSDNALYDGSWSEWGGLLDYPIAQAD